METKKVVKVLDKNGQALKRKASVVLQHYCSTIIIHTAYTNRFITLHVILTSFRSSVILSFCLRSLFDCSLEATSVSAIASC